VKNRILLVLSVLMLALSVGLVGCAGEVVQEYSLTVSSTEGGSVTSPGESGPYTYDQGEVVNLVAISHEGYEFVNWTGDIGEIADVEDSTTIITMNDDYSVTATFAVNQYTLVIHSTEGGSVTTPGEGAYTYDKDEVVNLVAVAEEDYLFTNWTGDVGTIADINAASTTITMNGGYSITANFAEEIRDWYDLDAARDDLNGTYRLMNDLDSETPGYDELTGEAADQGRGWEPIGSLHDPFIGSFDGQTHEIRDLLIRRSSRDWVGLFGCVGRGGAVQNLSLVNLEVVGNSYVGGLAGQINDGTVNGCRCVGSVAGHSYVGGLVGASGVGGIIGDTYSVCSVRGNLSVGGLVGYNAGTVSNSYSSASVSGENQVGGLVGENFYGIVSCSYSTGTVAGGVHVGGLVGHGLVSSVTNCYCTGSVAGDQFIGGLVGWDNLGVVADCYSVGGVTGDSFVGGLIGGSASDVTASFWDVETSGCAESDAGIAKDTSQMRDILTFSGLLWNIVGVAHDEMNEDYTWNIVDGQTYPFLSWQSVS
jgi:hypothetical protein